MNRVKVINRRRRHWVIQHCFYLHEHIICMFYPSIVYTLPRVVDMKLIWIFSELQN